MPSTSASGHFALAASGSNALAAAMIAVGLGPGDEVLIPAHTYMATATSVLAVGAIPVIVDIDESITISPKAVEAAIGPRTRAVVPVHMWGAASDMDAIMDIAARRNLIVIEDACQGVGGGYKGRKFGSIGHIGAFSFNYYKNMTSGEGGGVSVNDDRLAKRAQRRDRPLPLLLERPRRRGEAVRRQRGAGDGADGRDAQRPARPARRHGREDAGGEEADPRRHRAARQSRPEAGADEQPRRRLLDAGDVHAALGRDAPTASSRSSRA